MEDARLVEAYAAQNGIEAHFLSALLEEEGIPVRVVGTSLAMGSGELPLGFPTAPRLWVLEKDFDRARQLILEWEESRRVARQISAENPE